MIELYKKRGETPLEALTRLRAEKPELADETLSYAGRLDPMAEGVLTILVGKEENQKRKEFLDKDKIYEAHFLFGVSTDTHDVLGLVTNSNFKIVEEEKIRAAVESFISITKQTYPWYSSKTVDGIPLFEYARAKNFDIERPVRNMKIYSVSDITVYEVEGVNLIEQNIKDIKSVEGDFRQEEVVKGWEGLNCQPGSGNCHPGFIPGSSNTNNEIPGQARDDNAFQLVSCTLQVSSGTYIRALCEYLEDKLGVPVLLQKLIRTKIF